MLVFIFPIAFSCPFPSINSAVDSVLHCLWEREEGKDRTQQHSLGSSITKCTHPPVQVWGKDNVLEDAKRREVPFREKSSSEILEQKEFVLYFLREETAKPQSKNLPPTVMIYHSCASDDLICFRFRESVHMPISESFFVTVWMSMVPEGCTHIFAYMVELFGVDGRCDNVVGHGFLERGF